MSANRNTTWHNRWIERNWEWEDEYLSACKSGLISRSVFFFYMLYFPSNGGVEEPEQNPVRPFTRKLSLVLCLLFIVFTFTVEICHPCLILAFCLPPPISFVQGHGPWSLSERQGGRLRWELRLGGRHETVKLTSGSETGIEWTMSSLVGEITT